MSLILEISQLLDKEHKMSTAHGEKVLQKPISEYAKYIKNVIPAIIPEIYDLHTRFDNLASKDSIQKGIIAFRDFLYILCDRLISDGHLFTQPQKTRNQSDYQFLHYLNYLLIDIGYCGNLNDKGNLMIINEVPAFTTSKFNIPISKQMDVLRFLSLCGFVFYDIDLNEKMPEISDDQPLQVSFPNNPILLIGLKTLAIAEIELRTTRRYSNDDNLLWCDYRLLKVEDREDAFNVIKNYLFPLPKKVQEFGLELYKHYSDNGMTFTTIRSNGFRISCSNVINSRKDLPSRDIYDKRVWEFAISYKDGYNIVVRSKKTDKYRDIIEKFPKQLKEKINKGYGCDRKLRNERCQGGCQGILIPLNDTILEIKNDIITWFDMELGLL